MLILTSSTPGIKMMEPELINGGQEQLTILINGTKMHQREGQLEALLLDGAQLNL